MTNFNTMIIYFYIYLLFCFNSSISQFNHQCVLINFF